MSESKERKLIISLRAHTIMLAIVIAATSLIFVFWNQRRSSDYSYMLSGAVNLQYWKESDGRPIILKEGWEFYPNHLLTPAMIWASRDENAKTQYSYYRNVSISTNGWTDLGPKAELYDFGESNTDLGAFGVGTYRIVLQLSPGVDFITLNIPSISQSATIWVNNQEARHFGKIADNKQDYMPAEVCTDIQIEPDESGKIEIVIQCANFSSPHGGIVNSPCLASAATVSIIDYSARMFLTVIAAFLVFFLFGGIYISRTFFDKKKYYFFLLMLLCELLYELFAPSVTLLSGNWNMLIRTSMIILANYWTFLFYSSLYPQGVSKLFDKLKLFDSVLMPLLTALYLVVYWCFPDRLYLNSSIVANAVLLTLTNAYCFFRVFYMLYRHKHGQYLYTGAILLTLIIHISYFIRTQYFIYVTLHSFFLLIWGFAFSFYFVVDYVRTYEKLAYNNKNLENAVEEKTKYIIRVNQDLLKNHEKLLENEEARKKMMSNVSHDLRTPITAIRGYIELMLNAKEPLSHEQEVTYLSNMHTRSVQMEQLISDLVQLTRMESENDTLDIMPVSVKEMVQDLYNLYHAECEGTDKVITFSAPPDDDLMIDGDPKKLLRVFENIIVNAMKYTREDGVINIILHRYEDPAMLGGNAVEVLVKDNGVGIPESEVPYVFDRFYRAENSGINKTGSGLGLSIVKSVMDKHGGKIWAESEEGKGSEFHIVFKASEFNFDEEPEE